MGQPTLQSLLNDFTARESEKSTAHDEQVAALKAVNDAQAVVATQNAALPILNQNYAAASAAAQAALDALTAAVTSTVA